MYAAVGQPQMLHRSCQKMPECLVAAGSIVLTEFDRGAARPWNEESTAGSFDSVRTNFRAFAEEAAMAVTPPGS
jgi:hypothetical protein